MPNTIQTHKVTEMKICTQIASAFGVAKSNSRTESSTFKCKNNGRKQINFKHMSPSYNVLKSHNTKDGVTKSNSCTKSSTRIQMQEQWKETN
jgi:hypothetical protein